jgi:hypothetical protein
VLKMLRSVGKRHAGSVSQHLDAAFTLGQLLQQMKTMGVRQGFCDGSELGKQRQFGIEA